MGPHVICLYINLEPIIILRSRLFLMKRLDEILDTRGTFFKLLNGAFRAKIILKYKINIFFKL